MVLIRIHHRCQKRHANVLARGHVLVAAVTICAAVWATNNPRLLALRGAALSTRADPMLLLVCHWLRKKKGPRASCVSFMCERSVRHLSTSVRVDLTVQFDLLGTRKGKSQASEDAAGCPENLGEQGEHVLAQSLHNPSLCWSIGGANTQKKSRRKQG